MRYLEVRRHSMRNKPGQHLSEAGIVLARNIGRSIGPFSLVIVSAKPRAFETATAMGFAVQEQVEELSELGEDVDAEIRYDAGFVEFARVVRQGGATARFADAQARLWRAIAGRLPEEGQALIITHGGIIEAGAIACLPEVDFRGWDPPCSYCEGVRLAFDGARFVAGEVLRLPARLT
jgi:broad specificity phosphatase PhoE